MVIVGALVGCVGGKYWKSLRANAFLFDASAMFAGLVYKVMAHGKAPNDLVLFTGYVITEVSSCGIVLLIIIYFSDDDRRKRFRKKTSKAREKLIAKVKELAPTPTPKPLLA